MRTEQASTTARRRSADLADGDRLVGSGELPERGGRLLGVEEVADVLGVRRSFVYALARRGELPTVRLGDRYVRFRSETLWQWIEQQESTRPRGTQ